MTEKELKFKKICVRCQKGIREGGDYIRLTEYLNGKQNREQHFHKVCFDEMFNIKKLAFGMAAKANKLMEMAGIQLQ